ncbi:MAG: ComEC/Rec2 family competence protein [Sphingomonadales bacterium]|nr:ComEC/Rec2 family competence protein [Sphingomonadales bacterium]
MAGEALPEVPLTSVPMGDAAMQHSHWRKRLDLSSGLARIERFLAAASHDQGPWAVVGLIAGIASWFVLSNVWHWLAAMAAGLAFATGAMAFLASEGAYPQIRRALVVLGCTFALGCGLVWTKSALVGTPPLTRPVVAVIDAEVLQRIEQPAEQRVRLVLATREPETGRAIKVRLNLPIENASTGIAEGGRIRLRARLVPPAPPMLPGSYDFARAAWFSGLSATGSALGSVTIIQPATGGGWLGKVQRDLSAHVRSQLDGSPGAIAAALASGDRGAIAKADDEAMRDSGLSHLLSISGLHVSAVVAAAYLIALRVLALSPWVALRLRLPLVAAGAGAIAGIGYTLLSGAEVPTVRSCIGAILVLIALAIGREPLSMRMVAIAAALVLVFWPEALVGPSFQMSFAAVIAIVALHGSAPLRAFFAPREEGWLRRGGRYLAGLLLTGVVIELALMPIGLFHFHRSGVYGALANVIAIPLTTLATMPLIALALLFDLVGAGAPFWWLAGKSLELLLALAHATAEMPGAVSLMPAMGRGTFALFVAGGLWLALWRGRVRLLGLVPVLLGLVMVSQIRSPDLLVSGDGRHVGVTGEAEGELLVLRESRSDYARENLAESAGMNGTVRQLDEWPGARCNRDFCALRLEREGRTWQVLMARGTDYVNERELAAACEWVDIVIAARYLPRSCQPPWLKADRRLLDRTGGLTIDLGAGKVHTVAENQGSHGWWQVQTRGTRPPLEQHTKGTQPSHQAQPAAPVMQNQ